MEDEKRFVENEADVSEKERADERTADNRSAVADEERRHLKRAKIISVILSVVLIAVTFVTVPTLAWFYSSKKLAAYAPLDTPEALYIGTGRKEDIVYLYLSGIDTKETDHKDYVISITGEGITSYALQLGYTTNNQFTYELYFAQEILEKDLTGTDEEKSESVAGAVKYTPVIASDVAYYKIDKSTVYSAYDGGNATAAAVSGKVEGTYLNKQDETEILAETDDAYRESTYSDYDYVQKYAYPVYWQTLYDIATPDLTNRFTQYYILRVSWDENKDNDRETDVICIAAKAGSG